MKWRRCNVHSWYAFNRYSQPFSWLYWKLKFFEMENPLFQETILPLISKDNTQDVIDWMKVKNLLNYIVHWKLKFFEMENTFFQETILPLISKDDTQDVIDWMKVKNLLNYIAHWKLKFFEMENTLFQETILPLISKDDTQDVIDWMEVKNLLREQMRCGACETDMQWKCFNKLCNKRYSKVSIRRGSYFSKLMLS